MNCPCSCQKNSHPANKEGATKSILLTLIGLVVWFLVYGQLEDAATAVADRLVEDHGSHLHEALAFFLHDIPKVFMLLTLVVFAMGVLRTFFSPERTRALLCGKREGFGNIAAACLGIVTPFCSCSAVPLFIGFLSAGVPLGITFSFLISAPMINEVALGLLVGLVSWKVALLYLFFGLTIAIVSGMLIGKLHLEGWLEDWVRTIQAETMNQQSEKLSLQDRLQAGLGAVREIIAKVWFWMILGIAAGAGIHGYAPTELLASLMGKNNFWSLPAAVLLGVPMYSNAAGIIPVVEALLGKGAALGTVLAFMMSVTALSVPEAIILRKVLKPQLLASFIAIVTTGIVIVGFLFNTLPL